MEGGKAEINPCDEDGKKGHADGSSRDVPIQTDSEGAKKMVDMCIDGKEGKADDSSNKDDKMDGKEEEEEEGGEVDSSSGEESSSLVVDRPRPRLPHRNQKVLTSTDSSGSSSDFSYSSSLGSSSDSSDSS